MNFLKKRQSFIIVLLSCMLNSCTPSTHKSFVKRADSVYVSMIHVLSQVEHPQDLCALQQLRPLYIDIAELLILSLKQEEKHPQLFNLEVIEAPHAEVLREELARVYGIEGGRFMVENVAREGLALLQKSTYSSQKKISEFEK